MGAEYFAEKSPHADADLAFKDLRADALRWHGYGGYTGTIAEKNSYRVLDDSGLSDEEAETLASATMERADASAGLSEPVGSKGGPAGAIRLKEGGWLFFGLASS